MCCLIHSAFSSKFEMSIFSSIFQGGVQETETVLCDMWRAGLGVPALWPRTPVWELLSLYRVPTLPRTDPRAAALLTSPPTRTTTDSRQVSPDSTDASLWSQPLLKVMWRSFYNVVTTQALIWFCIFKMTFTDEWPVYSAQVSKWKALIMEFRINNVSSVTCGTQVHFTSYCSWPATLFSICEDNFKTCCSFFSNAYIKYLHTNHIFIYVKA